MSEMLFDGLSRELTCDPVKSVRWKTSAQISEGAMSKTGSPLVCMQSANCILKPPINPTARAATTKGKVMFKNQLTARNRHASARKAFERVLAQQAAPSRVGPIDYGALTGARLKLLDASSCHSVRVPRAHHQRALQLENQIQASWCRIRPAMEEVGRLLGTNGVDNLYWIGPLSQGSASPDEFFEFMFPPGVPDALMDDLAGGIFSLMEKYAGDEFILFQDWDTLTTSQQTHWAVRAIPLFDSVNPTSTFN